MSGIAPELTRITNLMVRETWYSGKELSQLWGVPDIRRKALLSHLAKRGITKTKGKTMNIRYRLTAAKDIWPVAPTKSKAKPAPSAVEELIEAASRLGAENEKLKQVLLNINTEIEKVREYL